MHIDWITAAPARNAVTAMSVRRDRFIAVKRVIADAEKARSAP